MWSLPAHQPEEGEGDDDGDHEATAAGSDLVDPRLQLLGKLVVFVAHGYILIGTELTCKGGKVNTETEDRGQRTECGKIAVQRWKAAYGLWKGGKVDARIGKGGAG
jgi:hypothetical protein